MYQEIYLIEDKDDLIKELKSLFQEENYLIRNITSDQVEDEMRNIPDLIIINEDSVNRDIIEICKVIRSDNDNTITPMIVISSNIAKEHRVEVLKNAVEYFIRAPIDRDYLYHTVKNIIRLMQTNRRVSPLTGLPGNVQIQVELKKRLLRKKEFAVLYLDLDNFKEYNDIYGFVKGDEIIQYTAKTIMRVVHDYDTQDAFMGHIGGDDFVAVMSGADYESVCRDILANFDAGISEYFTPEDLERGYLEVANRKGIIEQFPLTSLSIGVVRVEPGEYDNILEIGEVGAQVKHLAKTQTGSAYVINRRK